MQQTYQQHTRTDCLLAFLIGLRTAGAYFVRGLLRWRSSCYIREYFLIWIALWYFISLIFWEVVLFFARAILSKEA